MLEKTPGEARQESGLGKFIRTFDPDVPGYVFWLIMLVLIGVPSGGASRSIASSIPAHAFHCFQLASNSALASSSVATRLEMRMLAALLGACSAPEPAQ
jgi:hypothetical protein